MNTVKKEYQQKYRALRSGQPAPQLVSGDEWLTWNGAIRSFRDRKTNDTYARAGWVVRSCFVVDYDLMARAVSVFRLNNKALISSSAAPGEINGQSQLFSGGAK